MAKPRRKRKSSSASGRRSRRRSVANTHHRRRRQLSNPAPRRRSRRRATNRGHRRRSQRNPGSGKFMQGMLFLVGGGVGFFGSKAITQMVMSSSNAGVTGYFGNAAATAAMAIIAHVIPPARKFAPAIVAGGVLQIILRALSDNTQIGQLGSSLGVGDYQMQNFVTPQRLIAPLDSAQIEIPSGWGSPAPVAIATAAPPGAHAMSGYNTQGMGRGMYSGSGLYS